MSWSWVREIVPSGACNISPSGNVAGPRGCPSVVGRSLGVIIPLEIYGYDWLYGEYPPPPALIRRERILKEAVSLIPANSATPFV